MYYLFLDFDGVIVPEQAYFYWEDMANKKRKNPDLVRSDRCCPIAISNLNYVCKQVPNLEIVISSTWRKYFELEDLREILIEDGFKYAEKVVDITPSIRRGLSDSYGGRGTEIETWLKDKKDVQDWIALDDHANNIDKKHLIHTKQEVGFTLLDAYLLIERFIPDWERPVFLM